MYKSSILTNGLRVLTESVPGVRSVSLGVLVDASPQDDPDGKFGLAHFTEHAVFQGTSSRDAVDISRMIDQAGGQMGAFTSRDYTCFYAHVMQDFLPFAWELIGDILLNSTFPEDCLAREREVVLQEIGLDDDDRSGRINDLLKQSIWPNHPLGRPVAGDAESVRGLTREDVIYFVGQNYTPDRVIIAAAGAVDHDNVVAEAQDAFWRLLGRSDTSTTTTCEFQSSVNVERSAAAHSYFAIALPSLPYNAPQRYSVHALNTIVGGGISSRLYRRLREQMGLVYYVHSQYYAYRHAGTIMIEGVSSPDSLNTVLDAIVTELQQIANEGVSEEELWKTKMQMRGQHLLASDSLHTRMSRLVTQEFYFNQFLTEEEIVAGIDAVDCESVRSEAIRMLTGPRGLAVIGPQDAKYTNEQLEATLYATSGTREMSGVATNG